MTDNPESAKPAEEPVTPKTDPSQTTDSPPSGDLDVGALVRAVLEHPDYQKDKQSVKDKRIAEIQNSLEAQGGDLARLATALNVDQETLKAAQTKIAVEDMVQAYQNGTLGQAKQAPETQPQGSGVDLAKARQSIIENTGLPETHPGLDDFLATLNWNDPFVAGQLASAWATEQKAGIKQPTAADLAPPSRGTSPTTLSAMEPEELGTKLIDLQRDPAKNMTAINEIIAEFERRDNK